MSWKLSSTVLRGGAGGNAGSPLDRRTNGKTPYYFRLKDGSPFAFAGIWERWDKGEEPIASCALITCDANAAVAPVHDRMPVVLTPEDYGRWLDPEEQRTGRLLPLLAPLPDDRLTAYPVGKLVNDPRNEEPRCVERRA